MAQRYHLYSNLINMVHPHGQWVRADEHEEEVRQLKATIDACRKEKQELLESIKTAVSCCQPIP